MLKLKADRREVFGKTLQSERRAGRLPVVVYGRQTESQALFVDQKNFAKVLQTAGESTIVSLALPAGEQDVLIKDVVFHPLSGEPIHADFYVVEKGKKLSVSVPLVFDGVAPAVKELGGILIKVLHEVEVEALPKDLPHDLPVDLNLLTDLDSQVLIKDLKLPAGVEVKANPEEVVASITVAKEEPELSEPIDLESIEVEKKGKKEESETPEEEMTSE